MGTTLLDTIGKGTLDSSVLGVLTALLPSRRNNSAFRQMISANADTSSSNGTSEWSFPFTPEMLPDLTTTVLFLSTLVTLLDNAVEEAVLAVPKIFPVTFVLLFKNLQASLGSSQNPEVVQSVQTIMYSMAKVGCESDPNHPTRTHLREIGFEGLLHAASLRQVPQQKRTMAAKFCALLMDEMTMGL